MFYKKLLAWTGIALSLGVFVSIASSNNSWGGYHWARTQNPFTLELGNNVAPIWNSYLATTANDWSFSNVLNAVVVPGAARNSSCKATNGRVEVCSSRYGNTGWLGVAQIWVSGYHITKGVVKANDTYFSTPQYNTPAWRNFLMCQEVGHTLGLDHQDEVFNNANLGTCMDYTNDPDGSVYNQLDNQRPNLHDYDELALIYSHLDSMNTVFFSSGAFGGGGFGKGKGDSAEQNGALDNPSAWGQAVRRDAHGRNSLYARDLGKGEKVFTFVIWAR